MEPMTKAGDIADLPPNPNPTPDGGAAAVHPALLVFAGDDWVVVEVPDALPEL